MQLGRTGSLGRGATVLDQVASNALTPEFWLHEESIQLRVAIFAEKNGREPLDRTGDFCDEDVATFDLLNRKLNGFRIRQQSLAVSWIVE